MAYEVTATRKRPQDFDKLVGQEFVVSTLENAIKEKRVAHAYLFSGPRGVGKTSSARLLAKALNCEEGMSAHPCGHCASCTEITAGNSLDVIEIDGASNTSVNDIRAIKEEVLFPPQTSRYKIYIIDEVHMLSTSAFNALLKTIEEPPEYIIFIFATTELQKVPATIRSRCQQFRFQLIPQELILSCLRSAADDLDIEADEDALFWIAKEATGSMRDAYTLFDQVASFSGNHITLQKIREKLNVAGFSRIGEIVTLAVAGETEKSMESLSSLFESGVSAEQIVKDGADFFRTLLLWKNGVTRPSLLGVSPGDIPASLADALEKEQIEAALKAFMDIYRDLRYTISPRFETELLFSRLSSLPFLSSKERIMKEMEALRKGIAEGKVVVRNRMDRRIVEVAVSSGSAPSVTEAPVPPGEGKGTEEESKAPLPEETLPIKAEEGKPSLPSMYMEKEEEAAVDMSVLPALQDKLKEMGRDKDATRLNGITAIREEDGYVFFTTAKKITHDSLLNSVPDLSKALSAVTGRTLSVRLRLEENVVKEKAASEKMTALRAIFGGGEIAFVPVMETQKAENRETLRKEAERNEQPVRVYEADGEDGRDDEDDQG